MDNKRLKLLPMIAQDASSISEASNDSN